MKTRIVLLTFMGALALTSRAAIAPEAVLPANTFAVVTVPDMNAVRTAFKASPMSRLWNDRVMGEFTGKFEDALDANVFEPLLLFFDFDLKDYTSLVQGQATFALTRIPNEEIPGMIFLMDSGKEKAKALAAKLADLRELLLEQELLNDRLKIGGVDFMQISPPDAGGPFEGVYLGQSGSLLIATTSKDLAGQIVALHQKKAKKSLATHEGFANRHQAQLKGALAYGWLDFAAVMEIAEEQIEKNADPDNKPGPLEPTPEKVLSALGLKGLRSVSFTVHSDKQGEMVELYLDVPKAGRRGLFAMMAPPAKDAGPPAFVTADTASFARWRGDGAALWKQFEEMANEISPLAGGLLGTAEAAIRAEVPEFRLKENLIETIGDDFIVIDSGPKDGALEELFSPGSLYLIKSKKPAVTLKSIRQLIAAISEQEPEKREVGGSMIYSYFFQAGFNEQAVHLTTAGEYVALCLEEKALEKFLKGPQKGAKKLADLPGLKAAAAKVGGFNSGVFTYENQKPFARILFTFVKENPDFLTDLLGQFGGGNFDPDEGPDLNDWLDFKLLPDFKKVSKYFHFTVGGAKTTKQGISFRMYAPTPPALKE